jgi:hypothetical protein
MIGLLMQHVKGRWAAARDGSGNGGYRVKIGDTCAGQGSGDGFDVVEEHSPCGRDFSFKCTFSWSLLLLVAQCAVQRNTLSTKHVVVHSNGAGKT